jgi:hypothetical protein
MSDRVSNARSSRDGSAVPTATRVRERVKVRHRRRFRKERPSALDSEDWLAGARSRRLRLFTLGSAVVLVLVAAVYLTFRRP